jgi:hypothetical protein
MKLLLIIILILLGIAAMFVVAWFYVELTSKDPPDGTVIRYPEEDEYSPEQLDLDKTLKIISLRNKLKEIETKRKKK